MFVCQEYPQTKRSRGGNEAPGTFRTSEDGHAPCDNKKMTTPKKAQLLFLTLSLCLLIASSLRAAEGQRSKTLTELTMEDRVRYQKVIEEFYWQNRIWPESNPTPKPSLDQVLPDSAILANVENYAREDAALRSRWASEITARDLQQELDRIGRETKRPEQLKTLYELLGNDPRIIAETVARPILLNQRIRNFYANDPELHARERQIAEEQSAFIHGSEDMKRAGAYREVVLQKDNGQRTDPSPDVVSLPNDEWSSRIAAMRSLFGPRIQTGMVSRLQEDADRFYVVAVLSSDSDRIRIATSEWRKVPFDEWWTAAKNQYSPEMQTIARSSGLKIASTNCTGNTWRPTTAPTVAARANHSVVWTGTEMIVWGGDGGSNTGGRYNPTTDSWTPTSLIGAPSPRMYHSAVWTGTEMIIWGGFTWYDQHFNTGGRYNPTTDSWTPTGTGANTPGGRIYHSAVWTGSQMIIWGGEIDNTYLQTGGKYTPSTDTWTPTTTTGAPTARSLHTAVWTGSVMIVWGGYSQTPALTIYSSGSRYDPTTDSWSATASPTIAGRYLHTAVWTGTEMIVWGGRVCSGSPCSSYTWVNTGSRYNPTSNTWNDTTTFQAAEARDSHTAVWTGTEMIVWGGFGFGPLATGGKYKPSTNSWSTVSTTNVPAGRVSHTAVWSGTEMIVWGGVTNTSGVLTNTGGRYKPSTDSWISTNVPSDFNTPTARQEQTAVWTGAEMIVWGGTNLNVAFYNTGAKFDPILNTWVATSLTNAPTGRFYHEAIWTGTEMIVWGGRASSGYVNTGGRYNPSTDSWSAMNTTGAPSARYEHTFVWTGTEGIVWGGTDAGSNYLNSGARYNTTTDTWIATSTGANVPSTRTRHTAIWTGTEMIVWGGSTSTSPYMTNTGGKYTPSTDSWVPTSTGANAPAARQGHTALWTGAKMIVWGPDPTGALFDPGSDAWSTISTVNAPVQRYQYSAIWTGDEMIVWDGQDGSIGPIDSGGIYNLALDSWKTTSTTGVPSQRYLHSAVWTGEEMIVWGGLSGGVTNAGGLYCARHAGLSLTNSDAPDPVSAGASLTYTLVVTNQGPSTATGITLSDTLPGSTSFTSATAGCVHSAGVVTCAIADLASGASSTILVNVNVSSAATGPLTNTATVSCNQTEVLLTDNTAVASTTVVRETDLAVTITDSPDPVQAGNTLTYTVKTTNNGPLATTGVKFVDTLPAGVFISFYPGGCTYSAGVLTCTIGSLGVGATVTKSFGVFVGYSTGASISNSVTVSGSDTDPDSSNNVSTADTRVCQPLGISPEFLPNAVVGSPYNATLSASNGAEPYTYSVTYGGLPDGLTLDENTGDISGALTVTGGSYFEITATDANACTGVVGYEIMSCNAVPEEVLESSWWDPYGLSWPATGDAWQYNVYRGLDTDLAALQTEDVDSCVRENTSETWVTDLYETPPEGHFYWYIVRGVDACSQEGPAGDGRIQNATDSCP